MYRGFGAEDISCPPYATRDIDTWKCVCSDSRYPHQVAAKNKWGFVCASAKPPLTGSKAIGIGAAALGAAALYYFWKRG